MRINGVISLSIAAGLAVSLVAPAVSGDSDRRASARATRALLASPEYPLYAEECASCHDAYAPGLLPAQSWRRLMTGLDDHFGEQAELDPETTARLTRWLTANAAEARTHRKSAKVLRSLRGHAPLRVSEVPYIRGKHTDVDEAVFRRPSITSRANCSACHRGADRWDYDDDDVRIPAR